MSGSSGHGCDWVALRRHLLKATPVVLGITVATVLIHHWGWMRPFETAGLDAWLRIAPPLKPEYVRVVAIDEHDYDDLFGGASPLAKDPVLEILEAIAKGKPAVIVVDLDTANWSEPVNLDLMESEGVRVLWAQPVAEDEHGEGHGSGLALQPVLPGNPAARTGVSAIPVDWDGVIRRYHRTVLVSDHGHERRMNSLPWAAALEYLPGHEKRAASGNDFVLNFPGDRFDLEPIRASHVVTASLGPEWQNGLLQGKIVFLGGTYRAARDSYFTPTGPLSGVQLMALAVESELQHRGIGTVSEFKMILLEILGGFAMALFHFFFRPVVALWLGVVAIPVIALLGSVVAFSALAYWMNFIPVLLGTALHQIHDHLHDHRHLRRELEQLRAGLEKGET